VQTVFANMHIGPALRTLFPAADISFMLNPGRA